MNLPNWLYARDSMVKSLQAKDSPMTIDIPEDIALRLKKLAKQNDADIGDLLRDMLKRYEDECAAKQKRWATGADFA